MIWFWSYHKISDKLLSLALFFAGGYSVLGCRFRNDKLLSKVISHYYCNSTQFKSWVTIEIMTKISLNCLVAPGPPQNSKIPSGKLT